MLGIVQKKQKLTNYDVIESYTEDFTNWAYRNTRGTAKITNNTMLYIGKLRSTERNGYIGCHGKIIADRSFTEEEINWLKQNWDKI